MSASAVMPAPARGYRPASAPPRAGLQAELARRGHQRPDQLDRVLAAVAQRARPEPVVGEHDRARPQLRPDRREHRGGVVAAPVKRVGGPSRELHARELGQRRRQGGEVPHGTRHSRGRAPSPSRTARPRSASSAIRSGCTADGAGAHGRAAPRHGPRPAPAGPARDAAPPPRRARRTWPGARARERVQHRGRPDRIGPVVEGQRERRRHGPTRLPNTTVRTRPG